MAEGDFSVKAIISADTKNFDNGMKKAQASASNLSNTFGNLSKVITGALSVAGIGYGIKAFVDFGKKSVESIEKANKSLNILNNTLKATGATSWTTSQEMVNMSKKISDSTNYTVSEIQDMESVLLGFKNITKDTFESASTAITDMATVMGMDLKSAVQTVGKALDDPISGLDSLRRQGFAFTDEQKEEMKILVQNGKLMEAQAMILEELSTTYGGAAQAAQSSFAKQKNAMNELYETVGSKLLPITEYWAESNTETLKNLTSLVEKVNFDKIAATFEFLSETVQEVVKEIWNDLTELFDSLEEVFNDGESLVDTFVNYFWRNFNALYQVSQDVIHSVKSLIEGDWSVAWDYAKLVVLRMTKNVIESLNDLLSKNFKFFNALISGYNKILEGQDKVLIDFFHLPEKYFKSAKIPKLTGEDIIDVDGIEKMISEIEESIRESTGKYENYEIASLSAISAIYEKYIKRRTKQTLDLGKTQEKVIKNGTNSITKGLSKALMKLGKEYADITDKTEQWNKVIENVASNTVAMVGEAFGDVFTELGKELVENSLSWDSMVAVALEGIAKVLMALGNELVALAAVRAANYDYASAAAAAAGATAAFVAAGVLTAVAQGFRETSEAISESATNMEKFKELLSDWKSASNISEVISSIKEMQKTMNEYLTLYFEAQEKYSQQNLYDWIAASIYGYYKESKLAKELKAEVNRIQGLLDEVSKTLNTYVETVSKTMNETINEIESTIKIYDLFYSKTSNYFNLLTLEMKQGLLNTALELRQSMTNIGSDLGETLIDSLVDGATKSDFLTDVKKYIREYIIKLAVYTEEFADLMAKVGSNIASALTSKNISDLQEAKNQLEELWDSAEKRAKEAEEFLSSVFEDISEDAQDLTSEIEELGSTISDSLVSAVSDGLAEADFMDMMKSYIKNMVVNAVVYTEAIQSEIAAIGEAISNGIKEGFTETGLHEIKRDLSYIFYQANNAISSVDEILSSVFSGYATGTNNATSGLHIVGEAGPEIVRFRGGEQVLNAQNTQKALSGMGEQTNNFNVTFNNLQDTTAYAMINQLKQYNREMAINGII